MSPNTNIIPISFEIRFRILERNIESLTATALPTLITTRWGKAFEWMARSGPICYSSSKAITNRRIKRQLIMTRAGAGRAMGHSGITENIGSFNGPSAGAAKYDVLTALLVMASQGEAVEARLALRLSLLITARFNWRKGVFAVGQKELARMWGVTERTVKREMAELRARGWIEVAVPAARGRVAEYRVNFEAVLRETMSYWTAVGPDFAARLTGAPDPEEQGSNVVPLRRKTPIQPGSDLWSRIASHLRKRDPAVYEAWFCQLVYVGVEQGVLKLIAPTRFLANYLNTHFQGHLLAAALEVKCSAKEVKVFTTD